MLVVLKNQSVLSFCMMTFLWQNIKSYGGSLKKMVFGSLKSGVMFTMSELDTREQFFYNYLAVSLVLDVFFLPLP